MNRAFLEQEKDIEELCRIALALNASNAQLLDQLRKSTVSLRSCQGSKDELQQTLALIDTLTAATGKPVVELQCTLDDADRACPSCGGGWRPMTG